MRARGGGRRASADELEAVTHSGHVFGAEEGHRISTELVHAHVAAVVAAQERDVAERAGHHVVRGHPGVLFTLLLRRAFPPLRGVPVVPVDLFARCVDARLGFGRSLASARESEEADEGKDGNDREAALHGCTRG